MHWSAFLAYRRFPAHARVSDDLACAGCGYNLRSALANGNCPECGRAVGDSLFVLNKPEIVGPSLRTIGKTYLGFLALLLGCINTSGVDWPIIVAFGIMGFLAIIRTIAVGELRYRGAIETLPIIGWRLRLFWWVCLIDAILTCMMCVTLFLAAKSLFTTAAFSAVITGLLIAWAFTHLLCTFLAGWLGSALATMLWYTWARWEFMAQRIALGLCAISIPLMVIGTATSSNRIVDIALLLLTFLLLGFAMIATAAGLTHLGNGAETERDTWDDIIDTDPQGEYIRPNDVNKPERPAIKIE